MSAERSAPGTPDFYDDLDAFLAAGASLMARGKADRKSPAHTPTLATIGADGAPRLRTVVLRGFDAGAATARVHTDARAAKVRELRADPRFGLHAYHAGQKLQVRLSGAATVHAGDETARAAWDAMKGYSKRCYAADPAPGGAAEGPVSGLEALARGEEPGDAAFGNFALLSLAWNEMEVLYLHADGHRRARLIRDGARREAVWLVP